MNMKQLFLHISLLSLLYMAVMPICATGMPDSMKVATDALPQRSILTKTEMRSRGLHDLMLQVWNNPAINQYQMNYSFSDVGGAYKLRKESTALDVQQGDGETVWAFDAKTYIKHKNTTLWGRAYYNNGHIDNVAWNETSDVDMVYPYLMADSVGGKRLNLEKYSFMGGYAFHSNKLSCGASMSYTAGLYYRNVDPRPRNITADLHVQFGIGYNVLGDYVAGLSASFKKYKQTNEVSFYSELGKEKSFHLTGFANDYTRFAGNETNTYYNGQRWGASLNVHPMSNKGLSVSLEANRLKTEKVLTTLNKLPLTQATFNRLAVETGWLQSCWAVKAQVALSRRVGTENIFGDPAASVYVQIGEIDQFFENKFSWKINGYWEHQFNRMLYIAVLPHVGYSHSNTLYATPTSRQLLDRMFWGVAMKGGLRIGNTYHVITVHTTSVSPTKHEMYINGTSRELAALEQILFRQFQWQSHRSTMWGVGLSSHVAIGCKHAIKATVNFVQGHYFDQLKSNNLYTSISIIF